MKKSNNLNKNLLMILPVIGILLFGVGVMLFYSYYVVLDVQVYPADMWISAKEVGINADPDGFHFGTMPVGRSSGARYVTIDNTNDYGVDFLISGKGDLGPYIYATETIDGTEYGTNKIYIPAHTTQEIRIKSAQPPNAQVGDYYAGKVILTVKRHNWFS